MFKVLKLDEINDFHYCLIPNLKIKFLAYLIVKYLFSGTKMNQCDTLTDLPDYMCAEVIKHLDKSSLLSLSLCNKMFLQLTKESIEDNCTIRLDLNGETDLSEYKTLFRSYKSFKIQGKILKISIPTSFQFILLEILGHGIDLPVNPFISF